MSAILPDFLTCREAVELCTDYLEGAMAPEQRSHFEEHLVTCRGCTAFFEQVRASRTVAASLREEPALAPAELAPMLSAFRAFQASRRKEQG